jgi:hypothetical protein
MQFEKDSEKNHLRLWFSKYIQLDLMKLITYQQVAELTC